MAPEKSYPFTLYSRMSLSFSVITPSYCQGQFIERTIQSVLSQQEEGIDIEYIVCDGGSQDDTLEVLKKYEQSLKWISEADGGQADAVNKGIRLTSGEIIAWINSDDIYYPGAFRAVQEIFATRPEVQVVYGNANHIDAFDQVIEPYPTEDWNYPRLKDICFICQPATFFRRQVVEQYGDLDASLKFCMDYELWLRYGSHLDFVRIHQLLAGSRLYDTNKTLGQRVPVHYEINEMMVKKFRLSPEKWVLAYVSISIEERHKRQGAPRQGIGQRIMSFNEFFIEGYRAYWRWRRLLVSPQTFLRIFLWLLSSYLHFIMDCLKVSYHFVKQSIRRFLHFSKQCVKQLLKTK